jgi:hypothetical protein
LISVKGWEGDGDLHLKTVQIPELGRARSSLRILNCWFQGTFMQLCREEPHLSQGTSEKILGYLAREHQT